MSRIIAIALGAVALALCAAVPANAATFSWGPVWVSDGSYTHIRTYTSTYYPGGTGRIRFDVDNPHSVNIRAVPCGASYSDYVPITIPAHNQSYHYFAQGSPYGSCTNVYARSAYGTQVLSGYILG